MTVTFSPSGEDAEYIGRVYANDPMIDPSSRSLKVRALCDNPENKLVPGAFVELTLGLDKINNALMVPTTALVPLLNSQNVYIVKDGTALLREVTTGIRTEDRVQITKGVQTGDTLALTGLLALRNGMLVDVSQIVTHETN